MLTPCFLSTTFFLLLLADPRRRARYVPLAGDTYCNTHDECGHHKKRCHPLKIKTSPNKATGSISIAQP